MLISPATAQAEAVGVLEVVAPGMPVAAVEKFEGALVEGLEGADFTVTPRDKFVAELRKGAWVEGCSFGPCATQVYKVTGIKLALVVRVQGAGSSYTFIASLIDTQTGHLRAQAKRQCAACSVNDAELEAAMLGGELRSALLGGAEKSAGADSTNSAGAGLWKQAQSRRSSLRTTSYVFLALGVAAGGAGAYFMSDDDSDAGLPLVAGGGAAVLAGITMFVFSRDF